MSKKVHDDRVRCATQGCGYVATSSTECQYKSWGGCDCNLMASAHCMIKLKKGGGGVEYYCQRCLRGSASKKVHPLDVQEYMAWPRGNQTIEEYLHGALCEECVKHMIKTQKKLKKLPNLKEAIEGARAAAMAALASDSGDDDNDEGGEQSDDADESEDKKDDAKAEHSDLDEIEKEAGMKALKEVKKLVAYLKRDSQDGGRKATVRPMSYDEFQPPDPEPTQTSVAPPSAKGKAAPTASAGSAQDPWKLNADSSGFQTADIHPARPSGPPPRPPAPPLPASVVTGRVVNVQPTYGKRGGEITFWESERL